MNINLSKIEISTILSLLHPQHDREILNKLNHALDRLEASEAKVERMMKGTTSIAADWDPMDPVNW